MAGMFDRHALRGVPREAVYVAVVIVVASETLVDEILTVSIVSRCNVAQVVSRCLQEGGLSRRLPQRPDVLRIEAEIRNPLLRNRYCFDV